MKNGNPDAAWKILVASKGPIKENRVAFIAALIVDRIHFAEKQGTMAGPITPNMAAAFAAEFVRLAGAITALAVADCNTGLNAGQEKRQENLKARFTALAEALGFEARTGGDPRGACAYLIDPDNRKGDGWGDGFAVYS